MDMKNFLMDAVEQIIDFEYSDDAFAAAVNSRACFMAQVGPDEDTAYWLH